MIARVGLVLLALAGAVAPPPLAAADPLRQFVEQVRTLTAGFEQVQRDEGGDVLQRSSGRLWLARPGKFRWSYEKPYEQLLVCDAETIWMFDPDLAQVTVRPAREALAGTPAELLASRDALDRQFNVAEIESGDGARAVRLTPRDPDSDFREIRIWFRDGVPARMQFEDPLGGRTEIRFTGVKTNAPIEDRLFSFTVPRGVDVIQADGRRSK